MLLLLLGAAVVDVVEQVDADLAAVPALIYLIVASRIPESPRYLVAAGKTDEARAVLAKIAVLVFIIVFIQKRPQGIFAMKGREA